MNFSLLGERSHYQMGHVSATATRRFPWHNEKVVSTRMQHYRCQIRSDQVGREVHLQVSDS